MRKVIPRRSRVIPNQSHSIPKKPRQRRNHPEHDQQCLFVDWMRYLYPKIKVMASGNGAPLTAFQKHWMVREGMLKGAADLFIIYPSRGFYGLFIEMKSKKGKISPEQLEFMDYVRSHNFKGEFAWSYEEAKKIFLEYINGSQPTT